MADMVQIIITRGCDDNGDGGSVVESPKVVLKALPDKSLPLDALLAAFQDAYGLYQEPNPAFDPAQPISDTNSQLLPPVSQLRNMTTRIRLYCEDILAGYQNKMIQQAGAAAKAQQDAAIAASKTIIT